VSTATPKIVHNSETAPDETVYMWTSALGEHHDDTTHRALDDDHSHTDSVKYAPTKQPVVIRSKSFGTEVFNLLQRWDGIVQSVDVESVRAIIYDRTNQDNPEEGVVLELAEIPPEDLHLAKPGAVFYWSIGYVEGPGTPRQRVSRIRFRRLPEWTKRELSDAETRTRDLLQALRTD